MEDARTSTLTTGWLTETIFVHDFFLIFLFSLKFFNNYFHQWRRKVKSWLDSYYWLKLFLYMIFFWFSYFLLNSLTIISSNEDVR